MSGAGAAAVVDDSGPFLPVSKASKVSGVPRSQIERAIESGEVDFQPVKGQGAAHAYVSWPSLLVWMGEEATKLLKLSPEAPPRDEMTPVKLEMMLHAGGWISVATARKASSMSRGTLYNWVRWGHVETLRVANKSYILWGSLIDKLGTYAKLCKLDAEKVPEPVLQPRKKIPLGPRLQPGSQAEAELKKKGFISVREAIEHSGLSESMVRRWVRQGLVKSTRWGSTILVSRRSLDRKLREELA